MSYEKKVHRVAKADDEQPTSQYLTDHRKSKPGEGHQQVDDESTILMLGKQASELLLRKDSPTQMWANEADARGSGQGQQRKIAKELESTIVEQVLPPEDRHEGRTLQMAAQKGRPFPQLEKVVKRVPHEESPDDPETTTISYKQGPDELSRARQELEAKVAIHRERLLRQQANVANESGRLAKQSEREPANSIAVESQQQAAPVEKQMTANQGLQAPAPGMSSRSWLRDIPSQMRLAILGLGVIFLTGLLVRLVTIYSAKNPAPPPSSNASNASMVPTQVGATSQWERLNTAIMHCHQAHIASLVEPENVNVTYSLTVDKRGIVLDAKVPSTPDSPFARCVSDVLQSHQQVP